MRFLNSFLSLMAVLAAFASSSLYAAQQSYQAAGFTLTQPSGFEVREGCNGQVYFLELRRDDTSDDEEFAAIRLFYVPNAAEQMPAQQFLGMLVGEIQTYAQSQALTLEASQEVRHSFLGQQHIGQKLVGKTGSSVTEFEAYGIHWQGHLIGVLSKVSQAEQERVASAIETVLQDFSVEDLTADSQRREQLGVFQFKVSAFLTGVHDELDGGSRLRLGYPQGVMELIALEPASVSSLSTLDAWYDSNRNSEVKASIEAAGGQYLQDRWTAVWAGDGILTGTRMDLLSPDGSPSHVYSYFLRVHTHGLSVNFECTPENRGVMTSHLAELMASFTAPGLEAKLRDGLGSPNICQNKGLSFFYPQNLWLHFEEGDVPRFTLSPPYVEKRKFFQVLFDVHAEPLGEGGLLQELTAIVEQYYPGATVGESWGIGGRVFNQQREGLALAFTYQQEEYQINALSAPHRGGEVLTAVTCCAADVDAALWIFANLHGGFMDLEDGPRYISSPEARFTFDPAEWSLLLTSTPIGNEFSFKQRHGAGEVEVKIEAWNNLDPKDPFQTLAARARKDFESRRKAGHYNSETYSIVSGYSTQSQVTRMVTLGGATAVRNQFVGGVKDEPFQRYTTWAARLAHADVKVRATTLANDLDSQAAIEELLASLVLENAMQYAADTVVHDGLSLTIPAGYTWTTSPSEDSYLEITDVFDEERVLTLTQLPYSDGATEESMIAVTADMIQDLAVNRYGGSVEESSSTAEFLGQQIPLHRYALRNAEGVCESMIWMILARDQDIYHQFTFGLSSMEALNTGVDDFLAIIAAIEPASE
jgi:hypothetical protein